MRIAFYIHKTALQDDPRTESLLGTLREAGMEVYPVRSTRDILPGTDMILSLGGDGTFLSTAHLVAQKDIPILGVNMGRMGFLSQNAPEDVAPALLAGEYRIREMAMLQVRLYGPEPDGFCPYAVNEVSLHRTGAEMLGIDATVDDNRLPTYWADGLLVASSIGSTAYNLSAGGPICLPDSKVLLLTPVAPHNLNLRPLVIPAGSQVLLAAQSRSGTATLTLDNRSYSIPEKMAVQVNLAPFSLKTVDLGKASFIDALESRFFWGEDVRNTN